MTSHNQIVKVYFSLSGIVSQASHRDTALILQSPQISGKISYPKQYV